MLWAVKKAIAMIIGKVKSKQPAVKAVAYLKTIGNTSQDPILPLWVHLKGMIRVHAMLNKVLESLCIKFIKLFNNTAITR